MPLKVICVLVVAAVDPWMVGGNKISDYDNTEERGIMKGQS